MNFSLKLLVHLAVIGCFIGSTLSYPIDDKEDVSKFQFNKPFGQPPQIKVSALPTSESNGAIDDKGISTDGATDQQNTMGAVVVDTNEDEPALPLPVAASGQPLNQNIAEGKEPIITLDKSEIKHEAEVEVDVTNSDVTKAKTKKRSAEDDADDVSDGESTAYSFRQSSHNGQITERVFEKETNTRHHSEDSDSDVNSDSESDSDSDSDSDSKNTDVAKYVFKRSSDSQLSETFANTKDKLEQKGEAPVTDQPDTEDLDSRDSNTYGRSANDEGNKYYEDESLNFYSNSDDAQRTSFLSPSYDVETYSEDESDQGPGRPDEYTDDYRRAKRSKKKKKKVLSIIKNLKAELTKGQDDKDLEETPVIEGSLVTDKPELDETMKLVKESESAFNNAYENSHKGQPLEETIPKIQAYNDESYGVQHGDEWKVKKTGIDDTTDEPTEDDTFPLTSGTVEASISNQSPDVIPRRSNYRRAKRSNVVVLIAKKKGESEETAEVPIEEDKNTKDAVKSEKSKVVESQSNEKLKPEETPAITSDLEISNVENGGNQQEIHSMTALTNIGSATDDLAIDLTSRSKRSNDIRQKLVEINKKIENEQLSRQTNEETNNEEDTPASEIQQEVISSTVDEPFTDGLFIPRIDNGSFSPNKDEDPSSVTYSDDYGRVSRNNDSPISFGEENSESASVDEEMEHPFEEKHDEYSPFVRNDGPLKESSQPVNQDMDQ